MCRSIKKLRGQLVITDEEITAAARQFIRKVSGINKPSRANEAAFEQAITHVSSATKELLEGLSANGLGKAPNPTLDYVTKPS